MILGPAAVMCAQAATSGPMPLVTPPEFFKKYCFECHDSSKPKGDISLERLVAHASVGPHADDWENVAEMLETADMPAEEAKLQPSETERANAVAWIRNALKTYQNEHAGEPGRVTVRRLTSGEDMRNLLMAMKRTRKVCATRRKIATAPVPAGPAECHE